MISLIRLAKINYNSKINQALSDPLSSAKRWWVFVNNNNNNQFIFLHENHYITSTDYLQIAKLIEAGSMETYHYTRYYINTKNVTK